MCLSPPWAAVIFWADLLADEWSLLTECVRTGKPASQVRDPKIPSRWSQDAEADSIFRAVMGTAPAENYAPIAEAWDFSRAKVVADLGGGGGSLILAVLGLNPHLRGMLVDLESSVDAAKSRFAEEDPSSRCELIAADLMQSVPAGADVYMLKHVLHGRQDADAITILKNCRAVIPQNGSLLIIEFILPPLVSHADPQLEGHLMSDLNMLAVTGGKERSEREWRTLLEAAGFILTGVYPVGGDNLMVRNVGILEAKPRLRDNRDRLQAFVCSRYRPDNQECEVGLFVVSQWFRANVFHQPPTGPRRRSLILAPKQRHPLLLMRRSIYITNESQKGEFRAGLSP